MMTISGVNANAAQPLTAAEKALGAPKVQTPKEEAQGRRQKPAMDEYIPEEPQEPSGRYWVGRDEDGRPKIYFDDPERAADAPEAEKSERAKGTEGPERKGGGQEERYSCNTDAVDREIERLKKKQAELEQQLNAETDEARSRDLERQLAQVERELRQKDNDGYRKQHAVVTRLS